MFAVFACSPARGAFGFSTQEDPLLAGRELAERIREIERAAEPVTSLGQVATSGSLVLGKAGQPAGAESLIRQSLAVSSHSSLIFVVAFAGNCGSRHDTFL